MPAVDTLVKPLYKDPSSVSPADNWIATVANTSGDKVFKVELGEHNVMISSMGAKACTILVIIVLTPFKGTEKLLTAPLNGGIRGLPSLSNLIIWLTVFKSVIADLAGS